MNSHFKNPALINYVNHGDMTHHFILSFAFSFVNSLEHRTPGSHQCSHFTLTDVSIIAT